MSFKKASSNPFRISPDGKLSVKSTPPSGMPTPSATPPSINPLGSAVYFGKCLKVLEESDSGRNIRFQNVSTGQTLSLAETVEAIKSGQYPEYEICAINGVETPRSKADGSETNNLG